MRIFLSVVGASKQRSLPTFYNFFNPTSYSQSFSRSVSYSLHLVQFSWGMKFFVFLTIFAFARAHSPFNKHFVGQQQNRNTNLPWTLQNQQQPQSFPAERRNGTLQGGLGTNVFDVMFQWNIMDFEYPSPQQRANAIATRQFIPQNVIPLGVAVNVDRVFVSTPRWNEGELILISRFWRKISKNFRIFTQKFQKQSKIWKLLLKIRFLWKNNHKTNIKNCVIPFKIRMFMSKNLKFLSNRLQNFC